MPRRSGKAKAKFTVADKRALNKVKRVVNASELKVSGIAFAVDPNSTGSTVNLLPSGQGLDSNNRIGDKVQPIMIEARGVVTLHASATDSRIRMVIVRDNFNTGTLPSIASLYSSATLFIDNKAAIGDAQSRARFTILWDKMVVMDSGGHGLTQHFKFKRKLARKPVLYTGTAGTDEGEGQICLMLASNEATNDPVLSASSKIWYTDD